MVGVNGGKFPAIRKHLDENIGAVYKDMDLSLVDSDSASHHNCICFPDSTAFQKKGKWTQRLVRPSLFQSLASSHCILLDKEAIDRLSQGDAIIIFTPDSPCGYSFIQTLRIIIFRI